MNETIGPSVPFNSTTRRQLIAQAAIVLGGVAAASQAWGQAQQPSMKEEPDTAANHSRTSIHQEVSFKATPQRLYEILLSSKQFAAFTGMPAEIDPKAGGTFSIFGGLIVGRNVELILNQRIIQAWRPADWEPGLYTLVRFELKLRGSETVVTLDHTGFPEGNFDHFDAGWPLRYWKPLMKFLG